MGKGLLRIVLYLLLVTFPVWLAAWQSPEAQGIINDVGRNFALVGFMVLLAQFLLAARIKWIERAFGLDLLIRYHRYMAMAAAGFLILHPLLLALGHRSWKLLVRLDLPWYIWAGKVALLLVIANVLASIFQGRFGLKFEKWRLGHDLAAVAILLLMFFHSWFAGDDLKLHSMKVLWVLGLLLSLWMLVYHRFIRPARLRRQAFRVADVRRETENVWTVKLAPPEGMTIKDYLPGQFHFITFFRDPGLPVEEHHWTISSSPAEENFISSTIKAVGDFTATMGQTRAGHTAAVHGPFGRYSYLHHPEERDLVFLAGGIGITPLMAMLRHMRDIRDNRCVMLLYGNGGEGQILFRRELDQIADGKYPELTVVHVLSRPGEGWSGEKGHVDRERIEKYCGRNLDGKVFYVCGPVKMAEALVATLVKMGVSVKQIRREIFSFLD